MLEDTDAGARGVDISKASCLQSKELAHPRKANPHFYRIIFILILPLTTCQVAETWSLDACCVDSNAAQPDLI
jgi:hypothetical protein